MKRAAIYFFFDKDGIVDRYVPYYIQELHKVVDYIVVVVNGKLTPEGRKCLTAVSDDLFVRENVGLDAWAYKEAIEYIGWNKLQQYDELVLTNFTLFGPVYPFQELFDKMEADPCDFWGANMGYENRTMKLWGEVPLKWGYKPDAIASAFLVFKSQVLHSYEFRTHWENLREIKNYYESGVFNEFELYMKLIDAGFTATVPGKEIFRYKYQNPTVNGALEAIVNFRIPVFRRKAFYDSNGLIDYCTDIPRKIIKHIQENTDYDVNLIWENLLRTTNLYDLKNWFNWNNILPIDYSMIRPTNVRIAVIFHTYYENIMDQYLHNIQAFPDGTDFYFTTDTEEKQDALKALMEPLSNQYNIEYRLVNNRGRDVSALLIGCRDVVLTENYDLICYMHDKKGIGCSTQFSCVGQSFSDCCFENVAASSEYVNNVISLFERQPRLGVAVPPPPKNANYYKVIGGSWGSNENYPNVKKLLSEIGITVPIDKEKAPVSAYGSVFWFRPKALLPLFQREWNYEDFEAEPMRGDGTISNAIERSHGFIAQSQGYYTSVIINAVYAEQELTRMTEIAHTYVGMTMQYVGPKMLLKEATLYLARFLQRSKNMTATPARHASQTTNIVPAGPKNKAKIQPKKQRGFLKRFVRGICPIGLWNLFRRIYCALIGGRYIEPVVKRGPVKTVFRACMPRFLWDLLRKAKCKEYGWVFVED